MQEGDSLSLKILKCKQDLYLEAKKLTSKGHGFGALERHRYVNNGKIVSFLSAL